MKKYLALIMALLMVCSLMACGTEEEDQKMDSDVFFPEGEAVKGAQETAAQEEETSVIVIAGEGEVTIEGYELSALDDGSPIIVFTVNFKNTHATDKLCFNDVAAQGEELAFYQNGEKLDPKYIDKTNNINIEVQPEYTVKEVVKAYELYDTVTDVQVGVEQEDGSILFVQTLPIA